MKPRRAKDSQALLSSTLDDCPSARRVRVSQPPNAEPNLSNRWRVRARRRVSVELEVTLNSEHNFYGGRCENISVGGLFVATQAQPVIGERVDFVVKLPDGALVRGTGEVRWLRLRHESSDTPPGVGLKFIALDANSANNVAEFVQQREPMFYDE